MRLALLEDDMLQAELLLGWLSIAGHECDHYSTGAEFRAGVRRSVYGAAILDWLLPDDDGVEVLRWLRRSVSARVPVIMVTARHAKEAIVQALDAGADDYLCKPLDREETLARLRAALRRGADSSPAVPLVAGRVSLDRAERAAFVGESRVALTDREFDLAACFLENPGRLQSRESLLQRFWKGGPEMQTRSLDTHISRLRSKLELAPEHGFDLANVYGKGYRLRMLR